MKKTLLATAIAALALVPGVTLAQQVVRIAYVTAENSPQASQARLFAEEVEARLPGEFEFRFFPSGQLGNEQATLEQLQLGTLEMGDLVTPMTESDDRLGIFDLPWLFQDRAHVQRAITGDLKAEMIEAAEEGTSTKVLGIYENGFRHVMSPVAIVEPSDLKGLKIRLPGGQVRQEVFRMLGANPTPIDWSEVYTALQTGVVDGAEAAAYGFAGSKLYQVSPHLSLTAHNYAPSFLVASQGFWSGLSDEQKAAFSDAADAIIDPSFKEAAEQDQIAIDEIATEAEVNEIDFPAFQAAVQPVYDDFVAKNGSDWLDAIRAAQSE